MTQIYATRWVHSTKQADVRTDAKWGRSNIWRKHFHLEIIMRQDPLSLSLTHTHTRVTVFALLLLTFCLLTKIWLWPLTETKNGEFVVWGKREGFYGNWGVWRGSHNHFFIKSRNSVQDWVWHFVVVVVSLLSCCCCCCCCVDFFSRKQTSHLQFPCDTSTTPPNLNCCSSWRRLLWSKAFLIT